MSGAKVVVMSETASINIIFALGFSLFHLDFARESHRRSASWVSSKSFRKFVPLWPVTLAIYNITMFAFFILLTVVFL